MVTSVLLVGSGGRGDRLHRRRIERLVKASEGVVIDDGHPLGVADFSGVHGPDNAADLVHLPALERVTPQAVRKVEHRYLVDRQPRREHDLEAPNPAETGAGDVTDLLVLDAASPRGRLV